MMLMLLLPYGVILNHFNCFESVSVIFSDFESELNGSK